MRGGGAASSHSAGQTADGAVIGSAARTDHRCSLNKASIARMCVHDPKASRVTVVRATCEDPCYTACCFNYISEFQTYQSSCKMCAAKVETENKSLHKVSV